MLFLWVGTGFSLYANYPSGKALADQINANLPDKEKETDPPINGSRIQI